MKARAKTIGATRLFWSLVLGLGLMLGLLWAMMPRPAVEAQPVNPGFTVDQSTHGAAEPDGRNNAAFHSTYEPHIRLEKNENYYDAAGVAITQVTSLFIDEDEAWSRYQSGELDTIAPPLSELDTIKASPVYSPQLHVYPRQCTYYYGFSNDVPPFDDPLVRGAFASAIDRQRLISETLSGDELPALTFTPPGSFGHVDGYAAGVGRPYSPTLATDLLTASGYTGTPTITLMYNTSPGHQAIAEAIRQMWIDTLGITVTLQNLDWHDYLNLLGSGSADERPGVFRLGWCADYPDANNFHYDTFHSGSTLGYWNRYSNPEYDAVVEAAAAETLSTTRLSLYEQAESYLVMTDTAISPLHYYVNHRLTRPDLARTYPSLGGQHLDEWDFTGDPRPLEVAWGSPSTLDPARMGYDATSWNYIEQLFLGLTDFDETGTALPELATSWETSPDLTVYTFTMRSDVTWTNSISVVTAYDVEYGILRTLDPDTGSGWAYVLYVIENAQEYNEGSITDPDLVGVEALDATHVRFTLESPAAYFPVIAGLPPARPQPQWAIEAHGDDWTKPANIVTNGPYKLAAWQREPPQMLVNYGHDRVGANYPAGRTFWITVTDSTVATAAVSTTHGGGWEWGVDGFETEWDDWTPAQPDIEPGDRVDFQADDGYSNTIRVGTITGDLDVDEDTISGTIHAPWFAPLTLTVWCEVWHGPQPSIEVPGVAADGGSYFCDFAGNPDIQPGWVVVVRYVEPDGDTVINVFEEPLLDLLMGVNYGHDWVNGHYEAGHTIWLTATESDGVTVKATAVVTTAIWEGWSGFQTEWDDWLPSQPDIVPGDWVHGLVDNGYTGTVQIGTITGYANAASDSIAGTIEAAWITQEVDVTCDIWGEPGEAPRKHDTVFPNGVDVYSCSWDPATEWDVQPNQDIAVWYMEPDGDSVFNVFRAPWRVFLPLVLRNYP